MSEEKQPILPDIIPLFPLKGALLLPHGKMPLNVFEQHYIAMIDEALGHGRIVGMIQPKTGDDHSAFPPLFEVGCAGKIVSFSETNDGRYLIQLQGLCRFTLEEEFKDEKGFRRAKVKWDSFLNDLSITENPDFDRARLTSVLRQYFAQQGVVADWNVVQNTANEQLVSSLAMVCPLEANEKQALLEAPTIHARTELLITLLEMSCLRQDDHDIARH